LLQTRAAFDPQTPVTAVNIRSCRSSTPLVRRRLLGGDEGAACTCPPRGRRGGNAVCGNTAASCQWRKGLLWACAPPLERSDVREAFSRLILRHAPLDGLHHNIPRSNARPGQAIICTSRRNSRHLLNIFFLGVYIAGLFMHSILFHVTHAWRGCGLSTHMKLTGN